MNKESIVKVKSFIDLLLISDGLKQKIKQELARSENVGEVVSVVKGILQDQRQILDIQIKENREMEKKLRDLRLEAAKDVLKQEMQKEAIDSDVNDYKNNIEQIRKKAVAEIEQELALMEKEEQKAIREKLLNKD